MVVTLVATFVESGVFPNAPTMAPTKLGEMIAKLLQKTQINSSSNREIRGIREKKKRKEAVFAFSALFGGHS